MREVFFLIGAGGRVLYQDEGSSAAALPDSRARWQAIWEHREQIEELSHSHPLGPLAFSREDESTIEALQSALGRRLCFSIVAPSGMLRRQDGEDAAVLTEPAWAALLRRASGMNG